MSRAVLVAEPWLEGAAVTKSPSIGISQNYTPCAHTVEGEVEGDCGRLIWSTVCVACFCRNGSLPSASPKLGLSCNNCQRKEGRSYSRAAPAMSDLPPKWSEAKDLDSGDTYFWNTDTNETSWDRPVAPPTAGQAPPPPPPRRREQMATRSDDPEQLLLNPPDPNLICPICLKLFAQPVRTACGCACRLEPVPSTTHHCTTHQKHNPTEAHPTTAQLTRSTPDLAQRGLCADGASAMVTQARFLRRLPRGLATAEVAVP